MDPLWTKCKIVYSQQRANITHEITCTCRCIAHYYILLMSCDVLNVHIFITIYCCRGLLQITDVKVDTDIINMI